MENFLQFGLECLFPLLFTCLVLLQPLNSQLTLLSSFPHSVPLAPLPFPFQSADLLLTTPTATKQKKTLERTWHLLLSHCSLCLCVLPLSLPCVCKNDWLDCKGVSAQLLAASLQPM